MAYVLNTSPNPRIRDIQDGLFAADHHSIYLLGDVAGAASQAAVPSSAWEHEPTTRTGGPESAPAAGDASDASDAADCAKTDAEKLEARFSQCVNSARQDRDLDLQPFRLSSCHALQSQWTRLLYFVTENRRLREQQRRRPDTGGICVDPPPDRSSDFGSCAADVSYMSASPAGTGKAPADDFHRFMVRFGLQVIQRDKKLQDAVSICEKILSTLSPLAVSSGGFPCESPEVWDDLMNTLMAFYEQARAAYAAGVSESDCEPKAAGSAERTKLLVLAALSTLVCGRRSCLALVQLAGLLQEQAGADEQRLPLKTVVQHFNSYAGQRTTVPPYLLDCLFVAEWRLNSPSLSKLAPGADQGVPTNLAANGSFLFVSHVWCQGVTKIGTGLRGTCRAHVYASNKDLPEGIPVYVAGQLLYVYVKEPCDIRPLTEVGPFDFQTGCKAFATVLDEDTLMPIADVDLRVTPPATSSDDDSASSTTDPLGTGLYTNATLRFTSDGTHLYWLWAGKALDETGTAPSEVQSVSSETRLVVYIQKLALVKNDEGNTWSLIPVAAPVALQSSPKDSATGTESAGNWSSTTGTDTAAMLIQNVNMVAAVRRGPLFTTGHMLALVLYHPQLVVIPDGVPEPPVDVLKIASIAFFPLSGASSSTPPAIAGCLPCCAVQLRYGAPAPAPVTGPQFSFCGLVANDRDSFALCYDATNNSVWSLSLSDVVRQWGNPGSVPPPPASAVGVPTTTGGCISMATTVTATTATAAEALAPALGAAPDNVTASAQAAGAGDAPSVSTAATTASDSSTAPAAESSVQPNGKAADKLNGAASAAAEGENVATTAASVADAEQTVSVVELKDAVMNYLRLWAPDELNKAPDLRNVSYVSPSEFMSTMLHNSVETLDDTFAKFVLQLFADQLQRHFFPMAMKTSKEESAATSSVSAADTPAAAAATAAVEEHDYEMATLFVNLCRLGFRFGCTSTKGAANFKKLRDILKRLASIEAPHDSACALKQSALETLWFRPFFFCDNAEEQVRLIKSRLHSHLSTLRSACPSTAASAEECIAYESILYAMQFSLNASLSYAWDPEEKEPSFARLVETDQEIHDLLLSISTEESLAELNTVQHVTADDLEKSIRKLPLVLPSTGVLLALFRNLACRYCSLFTASDVAAPDDKTWHSEKISLLSAAVYASGAKLLAASVQAINAMTTAGNGNRSDGGDSVSSGVGDSGNTAGGVSSGVGDSGNTAGGVSSGVGNSGNTAGGRNSGGGDNTGVESVRERVELIAQLLHGSPVGQLVPAVTRTLTKLRKRNAALSRSVLGGLQCLIQINKDAAGIVRTYRSLPAAGRNMPTTVTPAAAAATAPGTKQSPLSWWAKSQQQQQQQQQKQQGARFVHTTAMSRQATDFLGELASSMMELIRFHLSTLFRMPSMPFTQSADAFLEIAPLNKCEWSVPELCEAPVLDFDLAACITGLRSLACRPMPTIRPSIAKRMDVATIDVRLLHVYIRHLCLAPYIKSWQRTRVCSPFVVEILRIVFDKMNMLLRSLQVVGEMEQKFRLQVEDYVPGEEMFFHNYTHDANATNDLYTLCRITNTKFDPNSPQETVNKISELVKCLHEDQASLPAEEEKIKLDYPDSMKEHLFDCCDLLLRVPLLPGANVLAFFDKSDSDKSKPPEMWRSVSAPTPTTFRARSELPAPGRVLRKSESVQRSTDDISSGKSTMAKFISMVTGRCDELISLVSLVTIDGCPVNCEKFREMLEFRAARELNRHLSLQYMTALVRSYHRGDSPRSAAAAGAAAAAAAATGDQLDWGDGGSGAAAAAAAPFAATSGGDGDVSAKRRLISRVIVLLSIGPRYKELISVTGIGRVRQQFGELLYDLVAAVDGRSVDLVSVGRLCAIPFESGDAELLANSGLLELCGRVLMNDKHAGLSPSSSASIVWLGFQVLVAHVLEWNTHGHDGGSVDQAHKRVAVGISDVIAGLLSRARHLDNDESYGALKSVLTLLDSLTRSANCMGPVILSRPSCITKLLSLLCDHRPSPNLVLKVLRLCRAALPLMSMADCQEISLPRSRNVPGAAETTGGRVSPSTAIVTLLLSKLGDYIVPGSPYTLESYGQQQSVQRQASVDLEEAAAALSQQQHTAQDGAGSSAAGGARRCRGDQHHDDKMVGLYLVFDPGLFKTQEENCACYWHYYNSSPDANFGPPPSKKAGIAANAREMTKTGRVLIDKKNRAQCLASAREMAAVGLLTCVDPVPVGHRFSDTPEKTHMEATCLQKNRENASVNSQRPFISGNAATIMASEVIGLLRGLMLNQDSEAAGFWLRAINEAFNKGLVAVRAFVPRLVAVANTCSSGGGGGRLAEATAALRHDIRPVRQAIAVLSAMCGLTERLVPGTRVQVTDEWLRDAGVVFGVVKNVSERHCMATVEMDDVVTETAKSATGGGLGSAACRRCVEVPLDRLLPPESEPLPLQPLDITDNLLHAVFTLLSVRLDANGRFPSVNNETSSQRTEEPKLGADSAPNAACRLLAQLKTRAAETLDSHAILPVVYERILQDSRFFALVERCAQSQGPGHRLAVQKEHCARLRMVYRDCSRPPAPRPRRAEKVKSKPRNRLEPSVCFDVWRPQEPVQSQVDSCYFEDDFTTARQFNHDSKGHGSRLFANTPVPAFAPSYYFELVCLEIEASPEQSSRRTATACVWTRID